VNSVVYPVAPVLLVDDNPDVLTSFASSLRGHRIGNIQLCGGGAGVEGVVTKGDIEVVLLDLNMPGMGGESVLAMLTRLRPEVPVIVVTGVDEAATAVRCMKQGAFDYLVKPVSGDALVAAVRRAIDVREVRRENELLREHVLSDRLQHPEAFSAIVTASRTMRDVFRYIEAIAVTSQPVLVSGETGVGKELAARAIHDLSGRKGRFVAVNIAGVDDNVFADTIFGHVRGAFTGADAVRKGLVEQAEGGTLFLDEIGELSNASQVKLLRLLQEREYFPVGSDDVRHTTARVIVATNRDLAKLADGQRFRADLFYRLRLHHVEIPPLRERPDDIPVLLRHFLSKAADEFGKTAPTVQPELMAVLRNYAFPGNVRELESLVFDAVSHHGGGVLSLTAFSKIVGQVALRGTRGTPCQPGDGSFEEAVAGLPRLPTMRDAGQTLVREALRRTNGNQTAAASLLGVTRQTMNRQAGIQRKGECKGD
jgi:DNA-binding NtrC family response regulator